MQKEPKKLTYKTAKGSGEKSLQNLLHKALTRNPKPEDRLESLGEDGAEVRFIAYGRTNNNALIGVFHKLTRGRAQEVIKMVPGGDVWPVHLVTAPPEGKDAQEFIEGSLYFGIWKNHVIVHQTLSCRAEMFQEHLSWLISRDDENAAGGGISKATLIELVDPVPPEIRKKSKVPVRRIIFGSEVHTKVATPETQSDTHSKQAKVLFKPAGRIWHALQEIFTELGAEVPKELMLNESLGGGDLKVAIDLSCTKKKSSSAAGELLGALGHSLSHSESAKYSVELADGTTIKGEAMKLTKAYSVECENHHPSHQSIFKCILEYMAALVENESIVEDEPFGNTR